jgi:hypothetical protein
MWEIYLIITEQNYNLHVSDGLKLHQTYHENDSNMYRSGASSKTTEGIWKQQCE